MAILFDGGREHFCEIILNLDLRCLWRDVVLTNFLSRAQVDTLFNDLGNFDRGHYEKHFCEKILNLDQWVRRCSLQTDQHHWYTLFEKYDIQTCLRRHVNSLACL